MKLTLEQIRAMARGAVRVTEEDGKVCLYRFTKEQEELYKVKNTDFYNKTFATAGIVFEFITDSRTLSLEVEIASGSSRKFFEHSIFVNDAKYAALGCKNANTGRFGGSWSLPEGENKIKIYFPWSVASRIIDISIDDGATLLPIKREKKMILFGDSITHGYDASASELTYATQLTDALTADGVNKGIGGEIFFPALAAAKDPIDPDYITVAYGTNDWSINNKEAFENNCKQFYENLSRTYPKAKIFAITPIWRKHYGRGDINNIGTLDDVEAYIRQVAASLPNVIVISGINFIPHDPSYFSPDVIHPNDKGFGYYFENLVIEIKKYID